MQGLTLFATELADAIAVRLKDARPAKRLYTASEAAEYLGCSLDQVELWAHSGRLRTVKLDRRNRYDRGDLDRLIDMAKV